MQKHIPVLFNETLNLLAVVPGGVYVDGTLGRAGHARGILDRGAGLVVGIDRDPAAVEAVAGENMSCGRLEVVRGRHGELARIAREHLGEGAGVDGVLLDLGVSSPQLDVAERGFSFRLDGPLDMRMDVDSGESAYGFLQRAGEEELAEIFWKLGEETRGRKVAKAVVRAREEGKLPATTLGFAELVQSVIPKHGARHPATKVFQALRMAVNDEVGELESALAGALEVLKSGGRLAVITFESITDRIVKEFMRSHAGREVALMGGGSEWRGEEPRVRLVTRKAVSAGDDEIAANPRSRSAKLRVCEKI